MSIWEPPREVSEGDVFESERERDRIAAFCHSGRGHEPADRDGLCPVCETDVTRVYHERREVSP